MRTQLISLLLLCFITSSVSAKRTTSLEKSQTTDLRDEVAQEVSQLQQQVDSANQQVTSTHDTLNYIRTQLGKMSSQNPMLQNILDESTDPSQRADLESVIKQNQEQVQKFQQQEAELKNRVNELKSQLNDLQNLLSEKQQLLDSLGGFVQKSLKNKKSSSRRDRAQKVLEAKK